MLIGVLSDTHLKYVTEEFRSLVGDRFSACDVVVHAGDFTASSVYYDLNKETDGKLLAVCGNMDSREIQKAFPRKRIVELEGFKLGLIHGGGSPYGIESRIRGEFDEVDAVVYGHTHAPANHLVKNITFFNPGSPTRSFIHRATLGILHLGEKIEGEIIKI